MNQDSPIVTEVRRIRHKIAEECGYDIQRIIEHARKAAQAFLAVEPDASANLPATSV